MATGLVASSAVNGAHASIPAAAELVEYQKIINLRDLVVAGQHPKLKPLSSTGAASTHASTANSQALVSNSAVHAPFTSSNGTVTQPSQIPAQQIQPNGQLMQAALPVPQDKTPLQIATEQNVSRHELELAIQQEAKRRAIMWPKLDRENILPDFDVDEILRTAQDTVQPLLIDTDKPVSKDKSPARSDGDQSYYSSIDDDADFATSRRELNVSKPCPHFFKGKCKYGDSCKFSHDPAFNAQMKSSGTLTEPNRSYANAGANGPPTKKQKRDEHRNEQFHGNQQGPSGVNLIQGSPNHDAKRLADEQYQRDLARAAQAPGANQASRGHAQRMNPDDRYDLNRGAPESPRQPAYQDRRYSGRGPSPSRDVPVVQSTITSPLAPQPARVSPLAMKAPYVEKNRVDAYGRQVQQIPTPNSQQSQQSGQQTLSRKRRRDNQNGGQEGGNARRRITSPEVRIKDEPVSPKPVEAVPRYVHREEIRRPVDVDAYHQEGRIEPRAVREVQYIEDPGFRRASSPVVRVLSRAGEQRHELRREPELRRVVSERQMIRGESPPMSVREPVYYDSPRQVQAAPREVYMSRSEADLHNSYRASVAPNGPPIEYAGETRHARSPIQIQSGSMAPPPARQRIVRDQYGNEFIERIITEAPRYSVAPDPRYVPEPQYLVRPASRVGSVVPEPARQYREVPAAYRRQDDEPTSPRYEHPAPQPNVPPSARAGSIAPGFQGDYAPERPQIVRINEHPREERYERVVREVVPAGYAERPREVYYDDMSREGGYRVQSVRPEATRYAEPDERYMRQGSMRPPPGGYDRAGASMALPPQQRHEYADGHGAREYTVPNGGPQYVG